ncbi:hypothetical protein O3M35_000967 [Rhynocoris fuscipes]|uniref:Intraflagellar transport protein 57 homolog n=1 Tax=Rhynocoris fuscipes TaxID=488301 RepID=A0AAW1DNG9_9HEMI
MSEVSTPTRQLHTADSEDAFLPFMMMESLLEKLKILNYEEDFIKEIKLRPLNRHYFALETNPGEQFYMFVALAAWLIRKAGISFDTPQEDDDPNSTVASIIQAMRNLGLTVDFSPNKLKKGSGWFTLQCLTNLTDKALDKARIKFKKPVIPVEQEQVSTDVLNTDNDPELTFDRVEEEMGFEDDSDFDEDNELDVDDLYLASAYLESSRNNEIIEANVTSEAWKIELERVTPLLKVSIKSASGDWRSHLEAMKNHQSGLNDVSSFVSTQLNKLEADIDSVMHKINKREKLINNQFDSLLAQHRALQEELAAVNEKYREVNVGVVERQKILSQLSDNLESVKQEMEERGATMSDGSPLVHIKKAIKDIKKEISEMDITIAVAEHMIVESKLRDKSIESYLVRTSGMN